MTINIALNGFGRIGRQLARQLGETKLPLRLKAINTLEDSDTALHLLKYDSIYGIYNSEISQNSEKITIGQQKDISFSNEPSPSLLPWQTLGIDLVIECCGHLKEREKSSQHLAAGAYKVVISAAAHKPDVTICMGVNHKTYSANTHHIISASSCTTNCIAPVLKTITDTLGIKTCMVSFLHSYTSGQSLLDSNGQDLRRLRSVHNNLIPTTTSAVHQIPEVIPQLSGKIDGLAIRLPTPNTHLADLLIKTQVPTNCEELTTILQNSSQKELKGILQLSKQPMVSIDYRGSSFSSIIDMQYTYVSEDLIKLLVWHDNEYSYCCRLLDLVNYIAHN